MIYRRYGAAFHSVRPEFDARALTEVGFRRDRASSIRVEELESKYRAGARHDLSPTADGDVQDATEILLLDRLLSELSAVWAGLDPGEILVVENDRGRDHPKTRQVTRHVISNGENRLRFQYSLAPPLRVRVYSPTGE